MQVKPSLQITVRLFPNLIYHPRHSLLRLMESTFYLTKNTTSFIVTSMQSFLALILSWITAAILLLSSDIRAKKSIRWRQSEQSFQAKRWLAIIPNSTVLSEWRMLERRHFSASAEKAIVMECLYAKLLIQIAVRNWLRCWVINDGTNGTWQYDVRGLGVDDTNW